MCHRGGKNYSAPGADAVCLRQNGIAGGVEVFWSVAETAGHLGFKPCQVYYLLVMGEIEAVKVGGAWRVVPGSARAYAEKRAARKTA